MTKHSTDAELKALYRDGQTWADDRSAQNAQSRRVAWIIASVATTIAALEAVALAGAVPLKTVVPYTVLVDAQTGYVTALDPTKPMQIAPDGALAKSMLAQYVTSRESVDRSTVSGDYRKVVLWSDGSARQSYLAMMKSGSPANPFNGLANGVAYRAAVKSVSIMDRGSALVRFDLSRQNEAGASTTSQPFVTIVHYRFRDRPLAEADRYVNPLGFEVVSYQRDAEVLPTLVQPVVVVPGSRSIGFSATATAANQIEAAR